MGSRPTGENATPDALGARWQLVIRFRERANAEKAAAQIAWAMNYAHLEPFDVEIEEVVDVDAE